MHEIACIRRVESCPCLAGGLGKPDPWAKDLAQNDRLAMALSLQAQTLLDSAKVTPSAQHSSVLMMFLLAHKLVVHLLSRGVHGALLPMSMWPSLSRSPFTKGWLHSMHFVACSMACLSQSISRYSYCSLYLTNIHFWQAVSELVKPGAQDVGLKELVANHSHLMVSLIQLLLSNHMAKIDKWQKSTKQQRLKDGLHKHIRGHFHTAIQFSVAVLINVSAHPASQHRLQVYEMQIAEIAMSDECPQKEYSARLLSKIGTAF